MSVNSFLQSDFPKVSIVIPVYNGASYLAEAINSCLAQTYKNLEIIVVNDGSNDNGETERIAQSFGSVIRYFVKSNGGVASALNLAIKEMSGDYFSWLSHDDLYCEDKVTVQVNAMMEAGHERTILYSDYAIFTDNANKAVQVRMQGVPPERFRYWITMQSALHGCTLLIPRFALEEAGGFNENLQTTQDYDLWFRLAEKYRFVHIPEVLVKARVHPNQGSIRMAGRAFKESSELLTRFVGSLTTEEVTSAKDHSIGSAYLAIASCMWRRGFAQAGSCAAHLARQYGVSRSRVHLALFVAYIQNLAVLASRFMLAPHVRQLLRSVWGKFAQSK